MALNIPNVDMSKWGDFSDILQNIMQNRMKGQELSETGRYDQGSLAQQANELVQTSKANEQLNQYRMGELGIKRQEEKRAALKSALEQRIANEMFFGGQQPNVNQQGLSKNNQNISAQNQLQNNQQPVQQQQISPMNN